MEGFPLIKENYLPVLPVYNFKKPDIASGSSYFFKTASGLGYDVTFGKKKNNYLGNIINFGVVSDEFEDEYSETNKGEVWRIITTIIEIFRVFHQNHPYSNSYEFSGEYRQGEDPSVASIRTRLFLRSLMRAVDFHYWDLKLVNNRILLIRKPDE